MATIPAHPYFLPKSGEHDVTLTSFTADPPEPWKIPSVGMCKIDVGRGIKCLVVKSYFVFFPMAREVEGGGGSVSHHPTGRGLTRGPLTVLSSCGR